MSNNLRLFQQSAVINVGMYITAMHTCEMIYKHGTYYSRFCEEFTKFMKPGGDYDALPFGRGSYSTTSFAGRFRVATTAAERFSVSRPNVRI